MELKPLFSHLRYEFLRPNHSFPVIVNARVNGLQIEKLLGVLQRHRGVICYSIENIKGTSLSLCMHGILLDNEYRPSRQPQYHLNPNMQEVV